MTAEIGAVRWLAAVKQQAGTQKGSADTIAVALIETGEAAVAQLLPLQARHARGLPDRAHRARWQRGHDCAARCELDPGGGARSAVARSLPPSGVSVSIRD